MTSEVAAVRFLLDEHYPGRLADDLSGAGVDTVSVIAHRPELRSADDRRVLEAAVAEARVVVTEDVSTFSTAAALVPRHVGIVYCHHARFPRTPSGLSRLRDALITLSTDPPPGLGRHPTVWWLAASET